MSNEGFKRTSKADLIKLFRAFTSLKASSCFSGNLQSSTSPHRALRTSVVHCFCRVETQKGRSSWALKGLFGKLKEFLGDLVYNCNCISATLLPDDLWPEMCSINQSLNICLYVGGNTSCCFCSTVNPFKYAQWVKAGSIFRSAATHAGHIVS